MTDDPPVSPPPAPAPPHAPPPSVPQGLGPPWLRGVLAIPYAFVLQILIFLLVGLVVVGVGGSLSDLTLAAQLQLTSLTYLLVIPGLWLAWRLFGQASLADMGHAGPPGRALRELLVGGLAGVVLLSTIVALGAALGALTIGPADWRACLAAQVIWLPALLVAAYYEELLLRGWVMQDLGRRWPWLGLVASSLLFALLHAVNPGLYDDGAAGALVGLGNIFLAGLLLGGVFLLNGRLWLPTGLHLGWNWTTAVLFGLPVSGFRLPSLLETEAVDGSGLLSGGAFGPEGSLPAMAVIGLTTVVVVTLALKSRLPVAIVARNAPLSQEGDIISESGPDQIETT